MMGLLQNLIERKNENNQDPSMESLMRELISNYKANDNNNDDNGSNDINIDSKYIIKRKKKEKKKRNYGRDMTDLFSNHTIIKKEVLKDLETKGFSDVKRYPDEEETEPINDPIHVQILYNFGFVLDIGYDKYNAILLLSTVINYNVIHIDVVRKLNLEINNVENSFVVRSSLNQFQSSQYVTLTVAVNIDESTNRMFTTEFIVSHDDHHKDMIIVNFPTLSNYNIKTYGQYEFEHLT
eukprot:jgi/Orpsp1_1/1180495/evm.model.c7180000073645.1